jgi:hypothetical protein
MHLNGIVTAQAFISDSAKEAGLQGNTEKIDHMLICRYVNAAQNHNIHLTDPLKIW